jgi:HAD superfamily hydrolase (TIGR01509 family)
MAVAEAVLFDLDGTLVDSASLWRDALSSLIMARQGRRPAADAVTGLSGLTATAALATVGRRLGWPAASVAVDVRWVEERVYAGYRGGVTWRDGALRLLAAARTEGAAIGLVTSSTRHVVQAVLDDERCPAFDVVVSGDEVRAAKPAPDPYQWAAYRLRLEPQACLAVEDSAVGIASALAAGCRCLHVGALTDVNLEDVTALLTKPAVTSRYLFG